MIKCSYCGYVGEYEWFWLITDDDGNAYSTYELTTDDYDGNSTLTEVYVCVNCGAEQ